MASFMNKEKTQVKVRNQILHRNLEWFGPPQIPRYSRRKKNPLPPPISPVFHPENRTKFPFPPKPPIILKTSPPKTPTTPLVLETQELIPKFPPTFSPESDIDPTQCLIPDSQPPSPPPSETQELFELELSSR